MFHDLKPCTRCEGKGQVIIEVLGQDPHEHMVAGMSMCHGCNGTGKVPALTPEEMQEMPVLGSAI